MIKNLLFTFLVALLCSTTGLAIEFPLLASKALVEKGMGRIRGVLKEANGESERRSGERLRVEILGETQIEVYRGTFSPKSSLAGDLIPGSVDFRDAKPVRTVQTDIDGTFSFDLPIGTYTLFFLKEGNHHHTDGNMPLDEDRRWRSVTVKENLVVDYNALMQKRSANDFGLVIFGEVK